METIDKKTAAGIYDAGGRLTPMTVEEVKQVELDMLREIDAFCRERDIRYSIAYGTLLGAVRHHGFIPWDDDIDIILPRDDYERFLREYHDSPKRTFDIICGYYADGCTQLFAKVRDPRTLMYEKSGNRPGGVFIDVFPVDGMSSCDWSQHFWFETAHFFGRLLGYKYAWDRVARRGMVLKYPLRLLALVLPGRFLHWLAGGIPRGIFKFRRCRLAGFWWINYSWRKERMPRQIFEEFVDMDFEGMKVRGIAAWHEFLSTRYGDYMKLPPESERVGGHLVQAFRIAPEPGK